MRLDEFLERFLYALSLHKIDCCVLRNHKGLPYNNPGNDIDFLIREESLDQTIEILLSMPEVQVTGYVKRGYVASLFLHGICWGDGLTALQVDFCYRLAWKGIPFLKTEDVLASSRLSNSTITLFRVPNEVHEALISFFASYLIGGWIKDKYQSFVREIFISKKDFILQETVPLFGYGISEELIEAVVADNRNRIINLLSKLRRKLFFSSLKKKPLSSLKGLLNHYYCEIIIRFTSVYLDTICILGPDGSGKSSVIEKVIPKLSNTTKIIERRHLKPKIFFKSHSTNEELVTVPHAKPLRSNFLSFLKILVWLLEEWLDRLFSLKKSLTLRIYDRYYHDLLVDPKRYRYGGPIWLARLVGRLIPHPHIFILLDAPPKVLQARKSEVSMDETMRQRKAYLELVSGMKNSAVVDASRPLDEVLENVNKIILNFMKERTRKRLGR